MTECGQTQKMMKWTISCFRNAKSMDRPDARWLLSGKGGVGKGTVGGFNLP